jgi:hypothetical protein
VRIATNWAPDCREDFAIDPRSIVRDIGLRKAPHGFRHVAGT